MIIKILGSIDLIASGIFMMFLFQAPILIPLVVFCALLLFVKGLFIFQGDILSLGDMLSSLVLISLIFITPWTILVWFLALFLLSKGIVSFT